MIKLHK